MRRLPVVITLFLLTLLPLSVSGAVKARPQSGIGLLAMRAGHSLDRSVPLLLLYREPKLGRIGERRADKLPMLAPAMIPAQGEWHAIVTGSRLGWLRIIYDEAEREGWVELRRSMEFLKWGEFLDGRRIAMLPGLKKEFYTLCAEASPSPTAGRTVEKGELLVVDRVDGDWAHVRLREDVSGWLRWRDENGRLTILLNPKSVP